MKRNTKFRAFALSTLLLALFACSEDDFSKKFPNPSETTTVTCEKLMTGVFWRGCDYTFKGYYGVFGWESLAVSRYSQVLGFVNSVGRYEIQETYYADRWKNFYYLLPQFRLLEATYKHLPEETKPDYRVFLLLAKIFMLDHLSQICDAWGDIPFSKAGYLPLTGDVEASRPSYDTAESIYETILNDLKTINDELSAMPPPSSLTSGYLNSHDFFNKGDLTKWRKYANSLRLRIALRVSLNGNLTGKARQVISEMLSDPARHPMVDANDEITKATPDEAGFSGYASAPREAYETWSGEFNRASEAMVKAMEGDPRIDILFDRNREGHYQGVAMTTPLPEQSVLFAKGDWYSAFDSATFSRNRLIPGVTVSAAEVSFAKAEAFLRGFAKGDAKAEFVKGVGQSVDFYFRLNAQSAWRPPVKKPDEAAVIAFAEEKWNTSANQLEAIGIQKWLNYGILQPAHAWTEIRRTGYPQLTFPVDEAAQVLRQPPNRFRYPKSEVDLNTDNYNAYKAKDNWTDKLFWAK